MTIKFQNLSICKGETLFREDDEGDCAYAIETGLIQISVEREGAVVEVATLGSGDIVGEMAIISSGKRSATATALEDCTLQIIEAQQFKNRIDAMDPVMRMAIDVILSRFRTTLKRIDSAPPVLREIALDPMPHISEAMESLRLESEIASAIRAQQFVPYYQAIVCLRTGKLAGFEALIRWHHPERGLVSPDNFIPAAEQTDLISQVTSSCLKSVGRDLGEMRLACLKNVAHVRPVFVSVNITGRDLDKPEFVREVEEIFAGQGLSPDMLKLEITESSLMTNLDKIRDILTRFRNLGIGIAIDDFGTGYSSMGHLAKLPISTLKIDRSFVSAIANHPQNRKIVKTILQLARELDIPVIAEGVEAAGDAAYLAAHQCQLGQGYLYSRPVPLREAVAMIRNWDAAQSAAVTGKSNVGQAPAVAESSTNLVV